MRFHFLMILLQFLAGCDQGTVQYRETGYRGKARLNAYLAGEMLLKEAGCSVTSRTGWQIPDRSVAMMVIPVTVLNTQGFVREIDLWVQAGGHLVLLGEHGESWKNDWAADFRSQDEKLVPQALGEWLGTAELEFRPVDRGTVIEKRFRPWETDLEVFAESSYQITFQGEDGRLFRTHPWGDGRISLLADARPLRNRYIGDHQHASLLLTLAAISDRMGDVVIIRDAALSFWGLLWKHGWPAITGLGLVTFFWLWKNMPRFGPLLPAKEPDQLRAYDQHLEALGDFHWRFDRAAGLLRPLRDSVLERARHQAAIAGHRDGNLFAWLATRSGVSPDRVQRALTHETPKDPLTFSRLMADLQTLHLSLP